MSQELTILNHLKLHGQITPKEAASLYKVRSLSRRIFSLREFGHNIDTSWALDAKGYPTICYEYRSKAKTLRIFGFDIRLLVSRSGGGLRLNNC